MAKSALIIGVTGQDGSYLAQLLLNKGYQVHGLKRRSSLFNTSRIDHLYADPHEEKTGLILHHGDLTDGGSLIRIIQETRPDEIYNLGAMSHVKVSFEVPEYTANVDGLGTLRILEAIRILKMEKSVKLFQASTSELYGDVDQEFQNELTPMRPQSPYAAAKLYAFWSVVNYRQAYGLFATNGILFNHESPVRGETFVTRKITRGIAQVVTGLQDTIYLGNLDAKRDWGHAEDYVMAMWMMLQKDRPDDFVIATGTSTSVREFLKLSFQYVGIDVEFSGKGADEKVIVAACKGKYQLPQGKVVVAVDPYYFRPCEVNHLRGDASKAKRELGWVPKHDLNSIIREMMNADLAHFEKEKFFHKASTGNPA